MAEETRPSAEDLKNEVPPASYTTAEAAEGLLKLGLDDEDDVVEEPRKKRKAPPPEEEIEDEGDEEDEDVDGEDEDVDEEDEDVDEDESDDEPDEEDRRDTFTVKVDGKKIRVTREELLSGYSRTADYTRKTQVLAEERKAFEADIMRNRELRNVYAERLEQLKKVLDTGTAPDWDQVKKDNPEAFPAMYAEWQLQESRRKAVESEQVRVKAEQDADRRSEEDRIIAQEQEKLFTLLPTLDPRKGQKKAEAARRALMEYGESIGVSEAEMGSIVDHRILVVLDKARQFDALQEKTGEVKSKRKKRRAVAPGSHRESTRPRRSRQSRRNMRESLKRLKATGSATAAAAALFELGDDD